MQFKPLSAREIAEADLLAPGVYVFTVAADSEKKSRDKGNDMIELRLSVTNGTGARRILFDYLMPSFPRKLFNACLACDLINSYEAGSLAAGDFVGKSGRVKIGIKKDKSGQNPDRNSVLDYVVPKNQEDAPRVTL